MNCVFVGNISRARSNINLKYYMWRVLIQPESVQESGVLKEA